MSYTNGNTGSTVPDEVSPKVKASTISGSSAVVLLYLVGQIEFVEQMPEFVKAALMVLITGAVVFLGGYVKRDPLRKAVR